MGLSADPEESGIGTWSQDHEVADRRMRYLWGRLGRERGVCGSSEEQFFSISRHGSAEWPLYRWASEIMERERDKIPLSSDGIQIDNFND